MNKEEIFKEACKACTCKMSFTSKELTLLVNACHDAALYRAEHSMRHIEKYEAMEKKLSDVSHNLEAVLSQYVKERLKDPSCNATSLPATLKNGELKLKSVDIEVNKV